VHGTTVRAGAFSRSYDGTMSGGVALGTSVARTPPAVPGLSGTGILLDLDTPARPSVYWD